MANKVSIHFKEERIDRATYIAKTVGFGKIVQAAHYYRQDGKYTVHTITETGVIILYGTNNKIITMFIARPEQVIALYKKNEWGKVPNWLMNKVNKNWKKGYTQNQPDYK